MSGTRLTRLSSVYFFLVSCLIKGWLTEVRREPSFFSLLHLPRLSLPILLLPIFHVLLPIFCLLCQSSTTGSLSLPLFLSLSFFHLSVVFSSFNHLFFVLPPFSRLSPFSCQSISQLLQSISLSLLLSVPSDVLLRCCRSNVRFGTLCSPSRLCVCLCGCVCARETAGRIMCLKERRVRIR